jgi:hypothetical protein
MMPRSEGQASSSRLVPAGFRRRGEDRGSSDNPRRSRGVGNPGDPARLRAAIAGIVYTVIMSVRTEGCAVMCSHSFVKRNALV